MKKITALISRAPGLALTAVAMTAVGSMPVYAEDIDFSTMIAGVSAAAVVAAFVGMGVVKLGPNFAKWAVNKVASFF